VEWASLEKYGIDGETQANKGAIFRETDRTNDRKYGGKYGMKEN